MVVKKEKSVRAKKSKYYSKKDYEVAKIAIRAMEQRKWSSAEKTAKKARDKSIYNFIRWKHLLTTGNQLAFYEYKRFIELNPKYPRINRIKYFESDSVLEEFYNALANQDENKLRRVHIPRSDVFYARRAYFEHTGNWESLDKIERSMYLEGMLSRHDVLDPDRKREWE